MGNDVNIETQPDISKDTDEIHTATLTFTYKTYIFGGTEQAEMSTVNPYIAPITKISAEVHAVPYLEPDEGDVAHNTSGSIEPTQNLSEIQAMTIGNYMDKVDNGQIAYPEYEMIDWIIDYQRDEDGQLVAPEWINEPFGYTPQAGDGLTYVNPRHRLYDQEVETNYTNVKALQSQNYVNQWGLPYQPIETRPWSDLDGMVYEPDEEELQAENPMGTDDYTPY